MSRPFLAEGRSLSGSHPRGDPDPLLSVHSKAMCDTLAIPDNFVIPVRRWHHRRSRRRAWRKWVSNLERHHAGGMRIRIENWHIVRTVLWGAIHWSVCVDLGIPFIGRDQVVHVCSGVGPIPQADHDITLDALWSRRSGRRILSGFDPIGPITVHFKCGLAPNPGELNIHIDPCLPRLNTTFPSISMGIKVAEPARNFPGGPISQSVTSDASIRTHDRADPVSLGLDVRRNTITLKPCTRELIGFWKLQHGKPVLCGVVLRSSFCIRCNHGCQIDCLTWFNLHLLRIHQSIASHPNVISGFWQIRNKVPSLIIRYNNLDVSSRESSRFCDHPNTSFWTGGPRDHTRDVVTVH